MSVTVLHENCQKSAGEDKKLPYTAYLVTYKLEGKEVYDLAIANKEVDLFDHYYDKYKNVLAIVQSDGKVPPKLWRDPSQKEPPKGKKKK